MTRRLVLIRHAKSAWDDPFADDHARTLNKRGEASARAIGEWLQAKGYVPDTVLSSDATRTRETTALLTAGWDKAPDITFLPTLYHASASTLLGALQGAEGATVAIVAHNPGIGEFAARMLADHPDHEAFWRYPTCATLVADFDIDEWKMARPETGQAIDFIVPRDLID